MAAARESEETRLGRCGQALRNKNSILGSWGKWDSQAKECSPSPVWAKQLHQKPEPGLSTRIVQRPGCILPASCHLTNIRTPSYSCVFRLSMNSGHAY